MTRPELSPDLRRFVVTNIPSVPYLEAILLLRAEPQRLWSVPDMARRLYIPEGDAAPLLAAAAEAGIAAPETGPAYRWAPASPELSIMLDRLAAHYAADVVTIATLIHGRTDKRAQQFADAFRWRKDT